ncbi:MAG: hypothetical protein ABSH45_11250 [Bryobacteraceae bacterium]|jgi:hypothetical protein
MAAMTNAIEINQITNHFVVVHPLDDVPEVKVDTENLGPMRMTLAVRLSLLSLRGYLALMMLLVFYHVLDMAGLFAHHA